MIVRHLHKVHELLSVLAQPTEEMRTLRLLLGEQEHFPSRRTWERRLKTLPQTLPARNWLSGSPSRVPDLAVADVWASGCHREHHSAS